MARNRLQLLIVAVLVINTLLIGWLYFSFRTAFPGTATRLSYKQEVARDLADYNYRLASELGVQDRAEVKEALAGFNYEVEIASDSDELTQVILNQGRRVQEIILREADAQLLEQILAVINQDENVCATMENTHLTVRISKDKVSTMPGDFLHQATTFRIRQLVPVDRLSSEQILEIDIDEGRGRLAVPYNPMEHLQAVTEELDSLRVSLHELRAAAGLAEMTGPGVIVHLYDEVGATTAPSLIHDVDIRDVVNELFGSGAQGISVGGQRLIVNSSIRCSGPLIKVNDKHIKVNPVEIQAVGNPDLLASGLDIIRNSLEGNRGIRFEVKKSDAVKLPAYVRSTQ